jgi:dihydrofolate reductase
VSRTIYYTGASLDGFIADEHNSLEWLMSQPTPLGERFASFFARIGAMAMGRTTYEWILDHEDAVASPQKWQEFYGDRPTWVFANREVPLVPDAPIHLVRGDVRPVHAAMVEAAGDRDVWLIGGGDLVGQFADHGLLDEVIVGIAPVTLGAGAPVLPRRLVDRLTVTAVEQDGVFAYLTYAVS